MRKPVDHYRSSDFYSNTTDNRRVDQDNKRLPVFNNLNLEQNYEGSELNSLSTIKVKFQENVFLALVDTGSTVNLIREDVYAKIRAPKLKKGNIKISGIGKNNIRTLGCFDKMITIGKDRYLLTFLVVPSQTITFDVVLGVEIFKHDNIFFSNDQVKIVKNELVKDEDISKEVDVTDVKNFSYLTEKSNKNYRNSGYVTPYQKKK